jgi:hypothetical protein
MNYCYIMHDLVDGQREVLSRTYTEPTITKLSRTRRSCHRRFAMLPVASSPPPHAPQRSRMIQGTRGRPTRPRNPYADREGKVEMRCRELDWFLKSASPFRSAPHAARGGSIIPHPGRRAGARTQSMKRASSCSHRIGASCHKKGKELERHFANSKSHPLSSSSCSLQ